jgi:hypothetical protein
MRSFKHNSRSYFTSRFANEDTTHDFASLFPVEFMFNYLRVYQQLKRDDSLFKNLPVPDSYDPASAAEASRFSLFTVSVIIENGCADITIAYGNVTKHETQVQD